MGWFSDRFSFFRSTKFNRKSVPLQARRPRPPEMINSMPRSAFPELKAAPALPSGSIVLSAPNVCKRLDCSLPITHFDSSGNASCELHGVPARIRFVVLFLVREDGLVLVRTSSKKHPTDYMFPIRKVVLSTDIDDVVEMAKAQLNIKIKDPSYLTTYSVANIMSCTVYTAIWVSGLPRLYGDSYLCWVALDDLVTTDCQFKELNEKALHAYSRKGLP